MSQVVAMRCWVRPRVSCARADWKRAVMLLPEPAPRAV